MEKCSFVSQGDFLKILSRIFHLKSFPKKQKNRIYDKKKNGENQKNNKEGKQYSGKKSGMLHSLSCIFLYSF